MAPLFRLKRSVLLAKSRASLQRRSRRRCVRVHSHVVLLIYFSFLAPPEESKSSILYIVLPVLGGLIVVAAIVVIVAVACVRRQKQGYRTRVHQLELATYRPPHLAPGVDLTEPPDEWELNPENLTLLEVLGEGYFGVVLKGEIVRGVEPTPSTPRRLNSARGLRHTSVHSRGSTSKVKTIVACKMLKRKLKKR